MFPITTKTFSTFIILIDIIKAKMPQIKFLNGVLEYDETRIRATTALLIELASIDKSFIRYTLNDTCPTAQIGLMVI